MKNKKIMLLSLLLITIGFATVSTTLFINGSSKISSNDADFKVYYSDAYVNGAQDLSVVVDETHLSFTTTLDTIGQSYVLDYDVTNGSKNYDADVEMVCTGGNDYLRVTNEFDDEANLIARQTRSGKLTLEMIKSNVGDDIDVNIECTIRANAVERNSVIDTDVPAPVEPVVSDEAQLFCESNGYSYGMFVPTTYADDLEDPDHGETSNEYYYCSNDEDFENYDGYDENGVLVSVNGVEVLDAQTFCETKNYSYGILNVETYGWELGGEEIGNREDAYYLCSDDPDFYCGIYGYDLGGNMVYDSGSCTDQ